MDELEFPEKQGNAKLWLSMLGIILLTGLAAWLIPVGKEKIDDIPPPADNLTQQPAKADAPQQTQEPKAEPAPVKASEQPPAKQSGMEGDLARGLIAEHESGRFGLDQLYARARELEAQKAYSDAWLLDFYAARKGHAKAALRLARVADPLLFRAGESILEAPDMVQAHKWYVAAAKYGDKEAPAHLQKLKDHIRSQAERGDALASSLLLQW